MASKKLPVVKAKDLIKALSTIEIFPVRQKGSHIQLKGIYQGEFRHTTVPYHTNESLPIGTLKGILNDCGLTKEDLLMLLKRKNK